MTRRDFSLEVHVDSKTVFDIVGKHSNTTKKRLQIDAMTIRYIYDAVEMEKLRWLPGEMNPADSLTKLVLSPLFRMIVTSKFPHGTIVWDTEK